MLPTFVIGLREGLEAALIVSIIATFLRRNGQGLRGMWIGVLAGVALSIAVGVGLDVVEQSLPQAEQEGMETVIGLVAVCFVTGMVLWMRTHARFLKRDLEEQASAALGSGTATALVVMAFLAVLREGFETSVFLLATFQSASSTPSAVIGAVLGIAVAVALGWGIYRGGVRLNLQRFFSITGVFLIFVAAGLVLSAFRTAHEAGWLTVGQQRTLDLSWLAPSGSIRSALISGVLGIPPDPRMIEVLAWSCYLLPLLALCYWPRKRRPGPVLAQRLRIAGAAAALLGAALLAALVVMPTAHVSSSAPVEGGGAARIALHDGGATLTRDGRTYVLSQHGTDHGTDHWAAGKAAGRLPTTIGVTALLAYTGNRVPVGLDIRSAPGPYRVAWRDSTNADATTYAAGLVDARVDGILLARLTGGGLTSPRVITIDGGQWRVAPAHVAVVKEQIAAANLARGDRALWKFWLPAFLVLVAAALLWGAYRSRPRSTGSPAHPPNTPDVASSDSRHPSPEGSTEHARTRA